jgi:NAD(P)-dependent dehydrogenase (short-subunit alcohol dehydrogenase family)
LRFLCDPCQRFIAIGAEIAYHFRSNGEEIMKAETLFSLAGKTALVTGAASGLGLAVAEVYCANGARVALLDIDGDGVEAQAARLREAGHQAGAHAVDIADLAGLRTAVDRVAADAGRLDIVVTNAGMSAGPGFAQTADGAIDRVADDAWRRVVDVNLTGTFATMQAAARVMKAQGSGRIIAVASIAGLRAEPLVGYAYAATKAAVVNLVRQASVELAPYNVLVTGIAPGPFRTGIAGGRISQPEVEKMFASMVPLGRIAEPDEIKGLALLLASDASSYMTGITVAIDGGTTAR